MSRNLLAILIVFLSPVLASAQSNEQVIQSEVELVSVLCGPPADYRSKEKLLKSYPQLVSSQLWSGLIERAIAEYYGPTRERSFAIYEIALLVADRIQNPKLLATTYYNIGRSYSGINELSKAVDAYERSKSILEQTGVRRDLPHILADLGRLYFILEEYEKARIYSERSLAFMDSTASQVIPTEPPEAFIKATSLATLADLHLRDGDYDQAIQKLQASLALHQKLSRQNPYYRTFIADDLQALGRVFTASGDYRQALAYLNQALSIVKSLSDETRWANLLNSIGILYSEQEDYAQAKKSLDESLQIYLSINKQREAAEILLNLGVIEQRQAHYDQALSLFQRSLQGAKATKSIDVEVAAGEGIGVVLTGKKEFPAAISALNASLELAKVTKDKTRQTELLWRSAETYFAIGDYERASTLAENAVALARESQLPKLSYLAKTTLGQAYAAQGKSDLAIQTLRDAVNQLEAMRDQVAGSELESQFFLENKVDSYHSLVDLLIKQDKPLDALLIAERAKGRVLLDVLSGGKADLANVLTRTEKEEIQRLNRQIFEINQRIKNESPSPSPKSSLYGQLDMARLEYQSYQDALYVAHPSLKLRTGQTASLAEADLNHLTQNTDTAYLEYVTGKDEIYLFVLTSKRMNGTSDLKVYPIKSEDLDKKVNQFHQRLANRHPDFASIAHELYLTLIEPAREQLRGIKTICIVPDGYLWNLPFQALMSNNRYLIEDYALHYAPSLSVLREMTKERPSKQRKGTSLIAFGNPVIGKDELRNEELCPLPEAETEVTSIAKTLGSAGNKVLIGRAASEKTFRATALAYRTIHLATHGVLDNRHPLYSHLLLTKTEGDLENDGLLEAREIMNMTLDADLAVLSACETANGRIAPGEGVMGMSWAFFIAGTRSMIVSQWKVNSASTSQLMMNFYRQRGSNTKATGLQKSAIQLMKDQRYRHPFYWSGFVLLGDGM